MAQKYLLPCTCGKHIPIETAQAGGEVLCECGLAVKVPSLLKIKKLSTVEEFAASQEEPSSPESSEEKQDSPEKKRSGDALPRTLRTMGGILLLLSILLTAYWVMFTYPKPQDVLNKRFVYTFGDKEIPQDSSPVPLDERRFLYIPEEAIDYFDPNMTMRYWRLVEDGPAMSLNFRENFQTLVDTYYIRCVGSGVLILISLIIYIASFFVSKTKVVAPRKGTDWR